MGSQATDMLTKADAIQVEYTEKIREARETASKAVTEYRKKTEVTMKAKLEESKKKLASEQSGLEEKLEKEIQDKMASAEPEIEKRKVAFVRETLASVGV